MTGIGVRELFVYYRIDLTDASRVRALVLEFQATLMADYPPLRARFLVRPESKDGQQTCMETYSADSRDAPDGVSNEWQVAVERAAGALVTMLRSPRHTEVFIACR